MHRTAPLTVDSLAPALARAGQGLLSQYLVTCPECAKAAAAHIGWVDAPAPHTPVLVRFVCPESCAVEPAAVLSLLPPHPASMTA